jgi:hypothetical protein
VECKEKGRRVGVAADKFGMLADQLDVEPFAEVRAVVAADRGQDTSHVGICERVVEVSEPFVAAASEPVADAV